MTNIKKYLLAFGAFVPQLLFAQVIGNNGIVDSTMLVCNYTIRQCQDTISRENPSFQTYDFVLEIGHTTSKYYNTNTDKYQRMKADPKLFSIYAAELQQALEKSDNHTLNFKPLALDYPLVVYTNYPQGERTIQNVLITDHYIYTEDAVPQEWSITSDTLTILGYNCHKATCNYRGRKYEAWFTIDIPIDKGPWKFLGLPGLILKVQDSKQHYIFELQSIKSETKPIEYIEYKGRKYTIIDRKKLLKMEAKMNNMGVERYTQMSVSGDVSKTPLNKNEHNYDLLEKDYR